MAITDIGTVTATAPGAAGDPGSAQSPDQLRALAQQFESLLMAQMLREMRASMFDDDKETGFGGTPLSETLFSELSLALSRAGGLGLGQALAGPLARQADGTIAADDPAALAAPMAVATPAAITATAEPALPAAAVLEATRPDGPISSRFGWRRDPIDGTMKFHKGLDIAVPVGSDVAAARAGVVTFAGTVPGYGLTVVVDHGGGLSTRYAHLSEIGLGVGAAVSEGQILGRSGATGRVTGPHLHFEVLSNGRPVDPQTPGPLAWADGPKGSRNAAD